MATKPASNIDWATDGGAVVTEPSAGQKADGWVAGDVVPDGHINFNFKNTDEWIKFITDILAMDGAAPDGSITIDSAGTVTLVHDLDFTGVTDPEIVFAANDKVVFDTSDDRLMVEIGGTQVARIDAGGLKNGLLDGGVRPVIANVGRITAPETRTSVGDFTSTITVPTESLVVGTVIRVTLGFIQEVLGTDTWRPSLKINGVQQASLGTPANDLFYQMSLDITIKTIGATGSFNAVVSEAAGSFTHTVNTNKGASSYDTTVDMVITPGVDNLSGSDDISLVSFSVDVSIP